MRHAEKVTFGGSGLNRAAEIRGNTEEIDRLRALSEAGTLPLWHGKPLLTDDERDPVWLPTGHPIFAEGGDEVFLGFDTDGPRFARDVSRWEPDEVPETLGAFVDLSEQRHPDVDERAAFVELRAQMTALSPRQAELVATAKAVLGWHATHRFCARCGAESAPAQSGWQRDCLSCGAHHFPRTDPVVIMLILSGNSVLIGRSPGWPEGMYSLLAGFVEPGETIEAAVRRETFEEAGVRVGRVEYLSSQPWPFPASLMLGCLGHALSRDIDIDPDELQDARWVTREELMAALSGQNPDLRPARKGAIARFLLENWLADRLS